MVADNKIEAYHGTSAVNATRIRSEQRFIRSETEHEWLGHGIYFFAYRADAVQWIQIKHFRGGQVVIAQLEYDDAELLDLDDPTQLNAVNDELKQLFDATQDNITVKQYQDRWKRWCWACNTYRDIYPEIGIIVYTFQKGGPLEPSLFRTNQRQICVSKEHIITAIN